MYRNKSCIADL